MNKLAKKVLKEFVHRTRSVFKFVIAKDTDLLEVQSILSENNIPPYRVMLMPEVKFVCVHFLFPSSYSAFVFLGYSRFYA